MKLSDKTIEQVKENRDLIESRDWLKIWETLKNPELNEAFVELGYNPLEGLPEVPKHYFEGTGITKIVIPDSVTSIGDYAFRNCSSLTSVTIGDGVESIGYAALAGCSSLTSIEIPNSVTTIKPYAFYNCSSLTSVVISDSVTSIGSDVFKDCDSLTRVDYTGTLDQWAQIKFDNSYSNPVSFDNKFYIAGKLITEAKITTNISDHAFAAFTELTSVEIRDGVTSIGELAFYGCPLTSIIIPQSVISIGPQAFYYCSSLRNIVYKGTVRQFRAIDKLKWWNYGVPETEVICTDGEIKMG